MTAGRLGRVLFSALMCCGLTTSGVAAAPTLSAAATVTSQPPQPPLQASPGEFAGVPVFRVLDTRNGTGEPGGAAKLAAGASLSVQVTGVDGVPADATSVVVNITALNTSASGYLTDYDSDNADPNVASVGVRAEVNTNQTDTISLSSSGAVSLANHTSGSADVVMSVTGYYTGPDDTSAGDTYGSTSWAKIVDTTTGLGTAHAPVPAGGSITVQVSGAGGIASGADTAVVQLSALNASQIGFLTAYAGGSADPGVGLLMYAGGMPYRDLAYVPLSASGQMTITNHASAAVDVAVMTRGYFMPPATAVVGAQYVPVGPVFVRGSSSGGTALAANASVTFQVSGTAGLPATGVVEVAEHVVVTSPASSGSLAVYRGGGTLPANPTMNFQAGDGTDVGYQDSILSQVSPTGQETITNESNGTLNLQVAVVGFFFVPQPPPVPSYLQTTAPDMTTSVPVLSGIVQDVTGDDPTGEIFLFDSSGTPIGGAPTATGQVPSGERVSWPVTDGTLTSGSTYQWYMEACDQGVCSAPSPTQTFTFTPATTPAPPAATATATITGSSITGADAITDRGACSGSDCPTASNGTLNAGSDGTGNWASGLKLNLSAIPAGSQIVSATLQLTESSCLSGSSCASTAINVYAAGLDVAAAATGPQLAGAASTDPITATTTPGSWDITDLVTGWVAGGDPNDGLVLQVAASGAAGIGYYSPSASVGAASLPQVTIGYIPPAVPGAPAGLNVTPGDGGALVSWSGPAWNYSDDTGTATASFTVSALTAQGAVAATQTTSDNSAVITGLTDGTPYTFTVTAANPVGTGPAVTGAAVTPAAVPGGPAQYITAVSQFLNAQDALNSGASATAMSALSNASEAPAVIVPLSNQNLADSPMAAILAANDQQDITDTTALSSTLAMQSPGGTVTVYATADETFTTVDTSSGTSQSVPGSAINNYLFTFTSPGSSPQLSGSVDADATLTQVGDGNQTAFSEILDGPAIAAADSGAPAPLATDSSGQFIDGADSPPGGCSGACQANAATWALSHDCQRPNQYACGNHFTDDCTDFVSRALAFGGAFPEISTGDRILPWNKHDPDQWYQYHYSVMTAHFTATSSTWANAQALANYEKRYGAYFYKYAHQQHVSTDIGVGAVIFAAKRPGSFGKIYHTGIVTKVKGRNLLVTQHTPNFTNRPLWATLRTKSWFNDAHGLLRAVWVANPIAVTSYIHH